MESPVEQPDENKATREIIDFKGVEKQENLPVGDFRENPDLVRVTVVCPECRGVNRAAKRACETCNGHGAVIKIVPRDAIEEEEVDLNCEMWAEVDFGRGSVLIRCTQIGEHDKHACFVAMEGEVEEVPDPNMN